MTVPTFDREKEAIMKDVREMILRVFTETIEDAKKFAEVSKSYKIHLTFCYQ